MTHEVKAVQTIDALLVAAGWYVWNVADATQERTVVEEVLAKTFAGGFE